MCSPKGRFQPSFKNPIDEEEGMITPGQEKKVLDLIKGRELVQLAVAMGNIDSPAGHEAAMADFVFNWLTSNGIEAFKQEVVKGRHNVVGILRGKRGGSSLLFNSHMDASEGGPGDEWAMADPREGIYSRSAWVEGERIFGNAVLNDRGPMAAFLIAAKAIRESGVELKGDLWLTAVVGEIGMAPIDEFQGTPYLGKGLGSRHLVNHGIIADYALVAETTDFGVTWAEAGVAYIKMTLKGQTLYTPRSFRPEDIEDHPNAIVKMARLIQGIEAWAKTYEKDNTYEFEGGEIVPKVVIGAIRGGFPPKPFRTSGRCSVYVDVRIPPGKGALWIREELERVARALKLEAEVEIYLYRRGYEGTGVSPIIRWVEKSFQKVRHQKPGKVPTSVTSMWRDINVFNEVGIPAITFGPPRRRQEDPRPNGLKCFRRKDLIDTSKVYALVAMACCG